MKKFEELGLGQELLTVIREAGFETPSEIQEKTIPLAIAGKDVIGAAATGSGKTLAFASSIIEHLKPQERTVQALILTPTRELAEQVADSISFFSHKKRLKVLAVYGGVNIETQLKKIPVTDVIVGTPGRILDHLRRGSLSLHKIKFLVLDEVDRMFDMGFLEDVEKILYQCSRERQTMLFSATISADVSYLAKKHTKNPVEVSVQSYVDHSKLKQVYYDIEQNEKMSLLVHLLKEEQRGLVMVFCATRHKADFVAKNLIKNGINAQAIHGGLTQNRRTAVLNDFHSKGVGVLVCTDVAARGLDIKGVTHIYNYDLPKTSTDYIHRIGRTARAGENGKVINLLCNLDYENFSNIQRDKNLFIESKPNPEFRKIFVELHRTNFSGGGNRGFSNNRSQGRSGGFGQSRGGFRPRTNFSGNRSQGSGRSFSNNRSSSSHSNSNQGNRRSFSRSSSSFRRR